MMLSDRAEKLITWACLLTFCLLCWYGVYRYVARQLEIRDTLQNEVQQIREQLKREHIDNLKF